jgi:hypothetical protein
MRMMEIGPAFDDIVDHPIMGREWAVPAVPFQGLRVRKGMMLPLQCRDRL